VGKKAIVITLVVLVSGIAVLGYFLEMNRKNMLSDPYRAISAGASLIIETADIQEFLNKITSGDGLFGELNIVKELSSFKMGINSVLNILNKPALKSIINDKKALIALFDSDGNGLTALLSLTVPSDMKLRQVREILRESGLKNISETDRKGEHLLNIGYSRNGNPDTVFLCIRTGLLLCSPSVRVLKEAIDQISLKTDIRDVPGFSRVFSASGKNEDRIFAVFGNLSGPMEFLFRKDSMYLPAKIEKLAGAAEWDIYINDEGLVLSGYLETPDSADLLYKYKSVPPGTLETYKILSSATILFETMLLPGKSQVAVRNKAVPEVTYILATGLLPYIGDEVTKAVIDVRGQSDRENTLVIYELGNRMQSENILADALVRVKDADGRSFQSSVLYFQPDDQVRIPVYPTPFKGLISVLLPSFAPGFDGTYYTFYDNYLVTGNSFAAISGFLYDNILNKTLANDLTFRDFEETLPSRAGYFFYCIPSRITGYLSTFLDDNVIKALQNNSASLKKIQAAGYQFAASNEMLYNSLSIRFKKEAKEETAALWETLLDTTAGIKPFFFTNHITGAKEIFIQDLKNNVYLINSAGRVLWKVPVREKISGNVFVIDYFRNGKLQLLFAGRDYLHLLDRNGNYVERYPVRLRSPAANSPAVFDYDNNRDYRIFIAGEDRIIYAYNKTGNVVKGWKPFKTAYNVTSDIKFFRVSGKDYIVVCDETSVYFLDRTGNRRLNLKEVVTKARGSEMRITSGADPSLVFSAPDGTVQKVGFDGKVSKFSFMKFTVNHSFDYFDIDGDGFDEYIFIDKGILYLYDHNSSEMFTRRFDSDDLGGPINFTFSATERKIGVYDNKNKLIYLIDKSGQTSDGFPLRGASMFSIGKLSEKGGFNLIVGGTDRFLYNYKIGTDLN
jgi:hypothetical protein